MRTQKLIGKIVGAMAATAIAGALAAGCGKPEPAVDPNAPAPKPGVRNTTVNPETGDRG